jgi:DNA mismatch endonuclease (patch repair protein)
MDKVSPETRSRIMSKVRSEGNLSTELRMILILKENGIIGWRRRYPVHGKPDFVFPHAHVALFVDGCFWHGCPQHCRLPVTNRVYWETKINRTKTRDKEINRLLKLAGWTVLRFWEHDMGEGKARKKIQKLKTLVQRALGP